MDWMDDLKNQTLKVYNITMTFTDSGIVTYYNKLVGNSFYDMGREEKGKREHYEELVNLYHFKGEPNNVECFPANDSAAFCDIPLPTTKENVHKYLTNYPMCIIYVNGKKFVSYKGVKGWE